MASNVTLISRADHLTELEINYELLIRRMNIDIDLENKKRDLRRVFQEEAREGIVVPSPFSIMEECDIIVPTVDTIEDQLQIQYDHRLISRLIHYLYRTDRCKCNSDDEGQIKTELFNRIKKIIDKFTKKTGTTHKTKKQDDLQTGDMRNIRASETVRIAGSLDVLDPRNKEGLDLNPKVLQEMVSKAVKDYFFALSITTMEKKNKTTIPDWFNPKEQVQSSVIGKLSSSESEPEEDVYIDCISDLDEDNDLRSPDYRRRQFTNDHHFHKTMEKWGINFNGKSGLSVEEFIKRVNTFAENQGVPRDILKKYAYVLLSGPAKDLYFAYYPFSSWNKICKMLRTMYGDPNKDVGIEERIQERKQNETENFVSFIAEIEKLNNNLNKKLAEDEKFKIIWRNMRSSYKKDLALVKVRNLKHLIKLCIKIDAEDQNLKKKEHVTTRKSVNYIFQQDKAEKHELEDSFQNLGINNSFEVSGEQEIHAITPIRNNMSQPKFNQQVNRSTNSVSQNTPTPCQMSATRLICWNCNRAGHLWNVCSAQKTIFCHLCGNPGKTANTCENHVGVNPMGRSVFSPSGLLNYRSQSQPNLAFIPNNQTNQSRPFIQTGTGTASINHPLRSMPNRFMGSNNNMFEHRIQSSRNIRLLELCDPENGVQYVAYPVNQINYQDSMTHHTTDINNEDNLVFPPSTPKN